MFSRTILALLLPLLVTQSYCFHQKFAKFRKPIFPFDLRDNATAQLDDLGQLVLGKILSAHDQLDDERTDVTTHSINMRLSAQITVEAERQSFDIQISELKELAATADKDISACLDGNEDRLEELPDTYYEQITDCIASTAQSSDEILDDARYNVDIVINKVQSLNFELGKCGSMDTKCIEDVIDQIDEAENSLPLEVDVAVRSAQDDVEIVKTKIVNCRDDGIADLVHEGTGILMNVTECVQEILSRFIRLRFARAFFSGKFGGQ